MVESWLELSGSRKSTRGTDGLLCHSPGGWTFHISGEFSTIWQCGTFWSAHSSGVQSEDGAAAVTAACRKWGRVCAEALIRSASDLHEHALSQAGSGLDSPSPVATKANKASCVWLFIFHLPSVSYYCTFNTSASLLQLATVCIQLNEKKWVASSHLLRFPSLWCWLAREQEADSKIGVFRVSTAAKV